MLRFRSRSSTGWNALILALGIAWLIREWVAMPVLVTGRSMLPTCREGQIAVVNKLSYVLHAPRRGDIVAVRTRNEPMIKRIVGLPGEEVAFREGRVIVNGEKLPEACLRFRDSGNIGGGKLEPGNYLVMGDNRSASVVAIVNESRIIGTVIPVTASRWNPAAMGLHVRNL
jgi:signal peptidase I